MTDCIRIVSPQLVNGTGRLLVPVAGSEHRCTTVFDLDTGRQRHHRLKSVTGEA